MKVFMNYNDNEKEELFKTLKITLPKSWKRGPTSKLLAQFVETYNESLGESNKLVQEDMHLAIQNENDVWVSLPSDAIVLDVIADRANVYVRHGPSVTRQHLEDQKQAEKKRKQEEDAKMATCTRFGCNIRFPKGGPYPPCRYHLSPPVFHETAKFWSCCPHKRAYDWNEFEAIPGCQTGFCTEEKENNGSKQFLGGMDLRQEQQEGAVKLRSIDDFNKAQTAGQAAPVLQRLRSVLVDLGIENELYNQVVDGIKKQHEAESFTEPELLDLVATELGKKLKASLKSIAAEQLRIK